MYCLNPICNNQTKSKQHKYCSRSCHMIVRNAKLGKRETKQCEYCGNSMRVVLWEKDTKKYCSKLCKNESSKVEKVSMGCSLEGCSNILQRTKKQAEKYINHYCSSKCASIAGRLIAQDKGKKTGTKPELAFIEWCKYHQIDFIHQYDVPWKRGWKKWYDFYLPKYRLLIEIDGVYWHGKGLKDAELNEQQKNTRRNDIEKNKLAALRGYNLLRIWEDEITNYTAENFKNYE